MIWDVTASRSYALDLVLAELDRQLELKASGKFKYTCEDMIDSPYQALPILLEEFGELARAMQNNDEENFKEELTQVAAIAISWLSAYTKKEMQRVC